MPASKSAPITVAIKEVAARALVPSLKADGFRKVRHHWSRHDDHADRGVTLQSSHLMNSGSSGEFTIEIGVSFPEFGHPVPDGPGAWCCAFRERLGFLMGAHDEWWRFSDAADRSEVDDIAASVQQAWERYGLPYLRACVDPETRCAYAADQRDFDPWMMLREMNGRTGMPVEGRLLDRCLESARAEVATRNQESLRYFASQYELLARVAKRLGRGLAETDRRTALEVVADARRAAAARRPLRRRVRSPRSSPRQPPGPGPPTRSAVSSRSIPPTPRASARARCSPRFARDRHATLLER